MTTTPDAWTALGTDVSTAPSAWDAIDVAGLRAWGVRRVPLLADIDGVGRIEVPDRFAIVRGGDYGAAQHANAPAAVLGVCGPDYRPTQNEAYAPLLDALVDGTGATFDRAGSWADGRRAFVTLRLPGFSRIGGDVVHHVVSLLISHDPKVASTVLMVTPAHESTGALLNLPWALDPGVWRVTPTTDAEALLDMVFSYLEEFQRDAQTLSDQPLTQAEFERRALAAYGPKPGAGAKAVTRAENKVTEMAALYAAEPCKTAWSALVALAAWNDHHSPVRGDERDTARRVKAITDPSWKTTARRVVAAAA